MPNLTLVVPEEMKHRMDKFKEMNWSEVARQAFVQKLEDLEFLRKFKEKSELTDKDALELGKALSKNVAKRYGK